MNEVKVYAMNKATPEIKESYNPDFIEPAVKKSDHDTEVQAAEDRASIAENAMLQIERQNVKMHEHIQALKSDLEALVKMYGSKKNWENRPNGGGFLHEVNDVIKDCDVNRTVENLIFYGGKLAREIGDKNGIKYE